MNPYERHEEFTTEERRAQVVYLAEVEKLDDEKISNIVGLAKSTVKGYKKKFISLLELAMKLFSVVKETVKRVAKRVTNSNLNYKDVAIINNTNYDVCDKDGKEKCYLFEFFDESDKLIYSKVGTTLKNSIRGRLVEEIRSYTKSGYNIKKVNINRVWDCKELPAEGLESLIRSQYIKKYPHSFKKNDRFIDKFFDLAECDEIAENYLAIA